MNPEEISETPISIIATAIVIIVVAVILAIAEALNHIDWSADYE